MNKYALNTFVVELAELLTKYDFSIGVEIEGTTLHDIKETFIVEDGTTGDTAVLKNLDSFIWSDDLQTYLDNHPIKE